MAVTARSTKDWHMVLFWFGSSPTFSPRGFLMGTIDWLVFQPWFFRNEVFYGLFFVYRFGMLETRSIGEGYCHAGDDWRPPGSIRGHRGGCQRVIGGRRVLLEDTRGLPGCRASAAGWRNLSTQSGGPQSEQCDRPVSAGEKQMARTKDRTLFIEFHSG